MAIPQHNDALNICDVIMNDNPDNIISTFDFTEGFLQIPITKEMGKYLSLKFEGQCFQYRRLPFETAVSSSVFISVVNAVLKDLIGRDVLSCVNDIKMLTTSFEDNVERVISVMKCVQSAGMTLSLKKTELFRSLVKHLGFMIVGAKVAKKDDLNCFKKFENRISSKRPSLKLKLSDIQSLLGNTIYYSMFIPL